MGSSVGLNSLFEEDEVEFPTKKRLQSSRLRRVQLSLSRMELLKSSHESIQRAKSVAASDLIDMVCNVFDFLVHTSDKNADVRAKGVALAKDLVRRLRKSATVTGVEPDIARFVNCMTSAKRSPKSDIIELGIHFIECCCRSDDLKNVALNALLTGWHKSKRPAVVARLLKAFQQSFVCSNCVALIPSHRSTVLLEQLEFLNSLHSSSSLVDVPVVSEFFSALRGMTNSSESGFVSELVKFALKVHRKHNAEPSSHLCELLRAIASHCSNFYRGSTLPGVCLNLNSLVAKLNDS